MPPAPARSGITSAPRSCIASTVRAADRGIRRRNAGGGTLGYLAAHDVLWLFLATPFYGLAIGVGTTAAYTAAAGVIPANVRGAGFGLLTTASLVGLAVSPIVCGLLAGTSIRAVFALDVVSLGALAVAVHKLGGDSERNSTTPSEEPVPENL